MLWERDFGGERPNSYHRSTAMTHLNSANMTVSHAGRVQGFFAVVCKLGLWPVLKLLQSLSA
jgi:hypothetical protein